MTAVPDLLVGGKPPRTPFTARRLPLLARLCRRAFHAYRRRWAKRLLKRPLRLLFDLAYHGLRLGGRGEIGLDLGGRERIFSFDARKLHFYATYKTRNEHGHEPEVAAILETLLSGDRVFYDVGANWGYFTMYAAAIPGYGGAIHAFEPMPETFRDLAGAVRQLGLDGRVTCHRLALSNRAGNGLMATPDPLHSGIARLVEGGDRRTIANAVSVPLGRLDDLGLAAPFLLKIDVEEHEFETLAGGADLLERERPLLVFENWIAKGAPLRTLRPLRFLEDAGYSLFEPCWSYPAGESRYVWPDPDPPLALGPGTASGRRLALVRFAAEQRLLLQDQINVFACPRERLHALATDFQVGPSKP